MLLVCWPMQNFLPIIGPVQCQFVNFQGDDPEDDCVM
jgi:hypothetical protein